jgi:hypothetical protein
MRIIRTIFLLGAAAFLMPSPPEDRAAMTAQLPQDPPATEFLAAAVSTVADMRDFCTRRASVCDTAHYLAVKFEGKAKYSIELLYEWAHRPNDPALSRQALENDPVQTGSFAEASREAGQNTLQLEDLIPEWRAPKPSRQG